MACPVPRFRAPQEYPLPVQTTATWVGTWESIVQNQSPALSRAIASFRELEPTNPPFFAHWGPPIAHLLKGAYKEEALEILNLLWSLSLYSPFIERLTKTVEEFINDPSWLVSHLGILLAFYKEDEGRCEIEKIITCPSLNNRDCFKALSEGYLKSFAMHLGRFAMSFSCSSHSCTDQAMKTELARKLSISLLDEMGIINRGATNFWLKFIPKLGSQLPELYKKQLCCLLKSLLQDQELIDLLQDIGPPRKSHESLVHLSLRTRSDVQLTQLHSRQAALSALLTFPRQSGIYCFSYAPIIALLQQDPKSILVHLKSMIETGRVTMEKIARNQKVRIEVDHTIHCPFETLAASKNELLEIPFVQKALSAIGLPSQPDDDDGQDEVTTARSLICQRIASQSWSFEKQQLALNTAYTTLSSNFQNHLLSTLIHSMVYFSDNHLDRDIGSKKLSIHSWSCFEFLPSSELQAALLPLSEPFKMELEARLFIRRVDSLNHTDTIAEMRDDANIGQWGRIQWINENNAMVLVQTWEELNHLFYRLAVKVLDRFKSASPSIDWSFQDSALKFWESNLISIERELASSTRAVSSARGSEYPHPLEQSQNCVINLGGGSAPTLLKDFIQKPISQVPIPDEEIQSEICKVAEVLGQIILSQPANAAPVTVLNMQQRAFGPSHVSNLLPYNHSFKKLYASSPKAYLQTAILEPGKIRSLQLFSNEQKAVLKEKIQEALAEEIQNEAVEAFSHEIETPTDISKLWRSKEILRPHLDFLDAHLFLFCCDVLKKTNILNLAEKNHLDQCFQSQIPPELRPMARSTLLQLPDLTMTRLEELWAQTPLLAPFLPFFAIWGAPFMQKGWESMKLSMLQKNLLIQSMIPHLPLEISKELALELMDPTALSISTLWKRSPSLKRSLPTLQILLNESVEMISWHQWEEALKKLIPTLSSEDFPMPPEDLFKYLIGGMVKTQEKYSQETGFSTKYGLTLLKGAEVIQNQLLKINGHWEYNRTLDHLCSLLSFPAHILLADQNYETNSELWLGFKYGNLIDPITYYSSDNNGQIEKLLGDLIIDRLCILEKTAPSPNLGLRV